MRGAKFEINLLNISPDQALVHLLLPSLVPQPLVDNVEEGVEEGQLSSTLGDRRFPAWGSYCGINGCFTQSIALDNSSGVDGMFETLVDEDVDICF